PSTSVRPLGRPHVMVVMREDQLHADRPYAEYLDGSVVPVHEVEAALCDCRLHTLLLDQRGAVLSYGRGRRTASEDQRQVLLAVGGGCALGGEPAWRCDTPHPMPGARGRAPRPPPPPAAVPALPPPVPPASLGLPSDRRRR